MRAKTKWFLLVAFAPTSVALIHCVGDEPATGSPDDAAVGADSGNPDNFVPPTDSGNPITDAGADSACAPGVSPCILQIAGGGQSFCARDTLGKVYCWGDNRDGQLGLTDGGLFSAQPVQVPLPKFAEGVSVGGPLDFTTNNESVACAVLVNDASVDSVACWGANQFGQLGRGDAGASDPNPLEIPGLGAVARISVGPKHVCAELGTNAVYCWGAGDHGELGRDASAAEPTPTQVSLGGDIPGPAVTGFNHTCMFDVSQLSGTSAQIRCFGDNSQLQLGRDPSITQSSTPTVVFGNLHAKGMDSSGNQTCAVNSTNGVTCWGGNQFGQVGNGLPDAAGVEEPYTISSGLPAIPVVGISAGFHHTCALVNQPGNNVYCWGGDQFGQSGFPADAAAFDGGIVLVPQAVMGLPDRAVGLAAGSEATCALINGGTVWCWGKNFQGELGVRDGGDDDDSNPLPPVQIKF